MATQLIETEVGREMFARAVRNYDLMMIADGYRRFVCKEPWPHYVHHALGRTIYATPDMFCTLPIKAPSDCVWIVPGTFE